MALLSKIAITSAVALMLCGAAIGWHLAKARASTRKLVDQANTTRTRAEQGDASAQYQLGGLYYHGTGVPQSYNNAFIWYGKAADQGNPKGQYRLASMYYWGWGVQKDYAQAFQWYWKAANQGYANAEYDLSYMYKSGEGVPKDASEALIWCRKAADQGNADAEYALGRAYFEGKSVPQNYAESALWYLKAADQGYPEAEASIGYMYYYGLGSRQDYSQAAQWYRKAANHGDDYSRRALRSMRLPFRAFSRITLLIPLFGSFFFLFQSGGRIRNREQRKAVLAGLLGLVSVGLEIYGHLQFGTLLALAAVNPFFFISGVVSSAFLAVVVHIVWPQTTKIILSIIAIPFLALHVYAAMHYGLRYLTVCPRAFYSVNGWLIGTALALAILQRASGKHTGESSNNNLESASEAQRLEM